MKLIHIITNLNIPILILNLKKQNCKKSFMSKTQWIWLCKLYFKMRFQDQSSKYFIEVKTYFLLIDEENAEDLIKYL